MCLYSLILMWLSPENPASPIATSSGGFLFTQHPMSARMDSQVQNPLTCNFQTTIPPSHINKPSVPSLWHTELASVLSSATLTDIFFTY